VGDGVDHLSALESAGSDAAVPVDFIFGPHFHCHVVALLCPGLQGTLMDKKTWGDVLKDPVLLITFLITGQFFVLILVFNFYAGHMEREAKSIILQTYVVAFGASWGFWLGTSNSSRAKNELLAKNNEAKPTEPKPAEVKP
jgi:hypothetical protein